MSDTTTREVCSPTRSIDGHVLPASGRWDIDPGHTDLAFVGRHFMVTKVRGTVHRRHRLGHHRRSHLADSTVEVTINMASVESGSDARDEHIKSAELFDVEQFPTATFRSTTVDWRGTQRHRPRRPHHPRSDPAGPARGHLRGLRTRPVGRRPQASSRPRTKVNREDFGITWNVALEAGGVLVSKDIRSRSNSKPSSTATDLSPVTRRATPPGLTAGWRQARTRRGSSP